MESIVPTTNEQLPAEAAQQAASAALGIDTAEIQQIDEQFDLEHKLVNLYTTERQDRAATDEALFQYHGLLARTGRDGKFTPFLRDKLGLPAKRAYDIAMRRIARHQRLVGLITCDEYQKRMGNRKTNTPLRRDSSSAGARPEAPAFVQVFNVDTDETTPTVIVPTFTPEDIVEGQAELGKRENNFHKAVLFRGLLPGVKLTWFKFALSQQARRHGTHTQIETLFALVLGGTKPADKDDEWRLAGDEILAAIARNPSSAFTPDRDDSEDTYANDEDSLGEDNDCNEVEVAEEDVCGVAFIAAMPPDNVAPFYVSSTTKSDVAERGTLPASESPKAVVPFGDEVSMDDFEEVLF